MSNCFDCGKPLAASAEFCVHCGSTEPHDNTGLIFDLIPAVISLVGRALQFIPLILIGGLIEYSIHGAMIYSWIFWTSNAIIFFIHFKFRKISVFLFPIIFGVIICFMNILYGFLVGFVLLLINNYYYKKTQ
ncbi:hypothetical protein [Bacillus mycoides]|uniref:hypothetical protein n=1 Tax=Bacillus mycoides TaxID=1405 RepID=UPI0011A72481|nr:hypothetical protein [Bacillus mycoides]